MDLIIQLIVGGVIGTERDVARELYNSPGYRSKQ